MLAHDFTRLELLDSVGYTLVNLAPSPIISHWYSGQAAFDGAPTWVRVSMGRGAVGIAIDDHIRQRLNLPASLAFSQIVAVVARYVNGVWVWGDDAIEGVSCTPEPPTQPRPSPFKDMRCEGCRDWFQLVEPNLKDGKFACFSCRTTQAWRLP